LGGGFCFLKEKMDETHAAVMWLVFGVLTILGFVAVYLTPLASALGS
jgi:hypothetical protein